MIVELNHNIWKDYRPFSEELRAEVSSLGEILVLNI